MILKRPLGRTGLRVSPVGLGGHIFPLANPDYYEGYYGRRIIAREAFQQRLPLIRAAIESGLNLLAVDFDYEASALGRALRIMGLKDQVLVSAVIDFRPLPGSKVDWTGLENRIDRMMTLLEREILDLPQIRIADWFLDSGLLEDLIDRLNRIQDKGKTGPPVFYSGDFDEEVLLVGLRRGWFSVVARAFGWLNPGARNRLLPLVKQTGAGFIGFVPFQKGWLFDLAREAQISDAMAARAGLAWALKQTGVTSLFCGAACEAEVRVNALAASRPEPESEVRQTLDRLRRTSTYTGFLERVRIRAPHLAFDWRSSQEF